MENVLNKVKAKLSACVELFADNSEVTLPVTFKIKAGKVSAEIGKLSIIKTTGVESTQITEPVKVESEAEEMVNDVCTNLMSDIKIKWYEKLPEQFIVLAVKYNGVYRYVYHTLKNEDEGFKVHWRNDDGSFSIKNPYVTLRDEATHSVKYMMTIATSSSFGDKWRDFKWLKLSEDNYNRVVNNTLIADTTHASFKLCVYNIKAEKIMVVCFNEEELQEIKNDIKEITCENN